MPNPREPKWELYAAFLAVLTEGSLSAAARRLGASQPTIGRHIAQLERSLGDLVLFTRSQDGLTPTEAALQLEPFVRQMALASEAIVRTASGEASGLSGLVRITASEVIGAEVLPPLLTSFREAHPGVVIELALTNRTEDLLRRQADIAVRMVTPTQAALLSRKLGSVRLGLYGHRRYAERSGLPQTAAELADHAVIGFDREMSVAPASIRSPIPITRDLFALRTDNDLAGLAALRAGFGLGVCHVPLAERDPDLLPVDPDLLSFELGVWLVMHEDLKGVRRIRRMYDHLAAGLSAYLASGRDGQTRS